MKSEDLSKQISEVKELIEGLAVSTQNGLEEVRRDIRDVKAELKGDIAALEVKVDGYQNRTASRVDALQDDVLKMKTRLRRK